MSEGVSIEGLAAQMPSIEEWRRALSNAAAAVDAVTATIANGVRNLAEDWRSISLAMARIHRRNVIIAHRRRQHARRAEAKASRRARCGRPRGLMMAPGHPLRWRCP